MKKRLLPLLLAILLTAGGCAGVKAPGTIATEEPTEEPAAADSVAAEYTNVTVTVRKNCENQAERAVTDPTEVQAVQDIVFDAMVKSAAWEGVEVSELEECIILSFDWTADSSRQVYYQYDVDGRHVLQMGEAGMYTVMSDDAYQKLLALISLSD